MKISFEKRLILFFTIIFIGIIILGFVAYKNNRTTLETNKLIAHTKEVIAESELVLSLSKDIVMGSQRYVITGDSVFLGHFSSSKDIVFVHIRKLRELTIDNHVQQARVDSLNFIMKNRIDFSDLYIQNRNQNGFNAASKMIDTGRGKFYTDEIRDLINQIEGQENFLLIQREEANDNSIAAFNRAFYALLISVFVFLAGVFLYILENSKRRAKADEELKTSRENFKRLFEYAPYPTWVYDLHTLQFLEVNLAAINQYGFSREEFLKMGITAIRPPDEIPKLMESVKARNETDIQRTSGWKHRLRNGEIIDVEITSQLFNFTGRKASLVIANNITERNKTEEAIRSTNHFLDTILENIPNMIFVKDAKELRFIRFNKAGEQLLGYSRNDLIGKNDYDFFPKDQADFFTAKDRDVIKKGDLLDISEEPINTSTGEKFLHTKKIPITNEHGDPLYLLGISEDITERKIADQHLKNLNERFLKIFNLSPVAMLISVEDDGQIVQMNETFEKLFEIGKEEAIGKTVIQLKIQTEERRKEAIARIQSAGGSAKGLELELTKSTGENIDTLISVESIEIDNRKCLLTVFIDITDRKKIEQRMKDLSERFLKIFNLSPVAMAISNIDDGKITQANESFEKLFFIKKEEAAGKSYADLKIRRPEERAEILEVLKKSGGHAREVEMKLRRADGEILDALSSVEVIEIDNKKYLLSAAMDITQRKKAEEQILHLNAELEKNVEMLKAVNKELEAFSYSVSHDLRSPLRIIDGYADILIHDYKEKLDEEGNRTLQVIKSNAQRMGLLIDDLLNLSRLGRKELVMHIVNMDQLVDPIVKEQLEHNPSGHIEVKINKLEPANCDNSLIRQVWTNLISNAFKYSRHKEKAVVEIGSYKKDKEIIYYVKDNGVGFDMKYADKLFGVFQRLHKMTEFEGNGVGLAVAQRIVVKHKGRVWAEAAVDKGATFYFSLPA